MLLNSLYNTLFTEGSFSLLFNQIREITSDKYTTIQDHTVQQHDEWQLFKLYLNEYQV